MQTPVTPSGWEHWAAIATVAAVVIAPLLAWWGVRSSSRLSAQAVESGDILWLMEQYASAEMLEDLRVLVSWRKDHPGDDFAAIWRAALDKGDKDAKRVDAARRRVKHFFRRPLMLFNQGYVEERFVKAAASLDGINILVSIVGPLEKALNPESSADAEIGELVRICGQVGTGGLIAYHPRALQSGPDSSGA